uniref:Homing endonuclease LAGLIDADG domain-containing protein n=1 Tax=Dactylella tenuis TaxID=383872 RepID=A0A4Y5MZ55_9PEZI|nr:hypothetical protein [Dactylella tenuis]QCW06845.1 hypothetical protein [Dactylella tenuis]
MGKEAKQIAFFKISNHSELLIIIAIFSKLNLNTTKHLDFLAFAQGFMLYSKSNDTEYRKNLKPTLCSIINTLNSKRTNFDMSSAHKIELSANWILGFVEGDGSFSYDSSSSANRFSIKQKDINKAILIAIRDYFNNLARKSDYSLDINENVVNVYNEMPNFSRLNISRTSFIGDVLIPFFNSLTFQTKKI